MAEKKTYICDGCGWEVANVSIYEQWGSVQLNRAATSNPTAFRRYGIDKQYDLCDPCFSELLDFFSGDRVSSRGRRRQG